MKYLCFAVPGEPCAKGRPRIAVIAGHARAYTPAKTANYEGVVATFALAAKAESSWDEEAANGPIRIMVTATFSRPKRLLERSKRTNELRHASEGRMPHTSRPDLDNVVKAVVDGLNRCGIWRDDSQVCSIEASKWYAATNEDAHVWVEIGTAGGGA